MPSATTNHLGNPEDDSQPQTNGHYNYKDAERTSMPQWEYNGEIVISGISGKFPESNNFQEFADNLYNKVDMVTENDRRWTPGLYGLPTRQGKIPEVDKCDASFFGVHPKQANHMDPMLRILLEVTYEAIVDAGYNPDELRGKRVGVFVAPGLSETNESLGLDPDKINGYGLVGTCNNMFSNRVSYCFDFQGPSYTIDTACSAAMMGLDQAIVNLRSGRCDAAIVAGATLHIKPQSTLQFHRFSMLSVDGACKTFDASANGYARSESICAILIQKKDVARRNYATIVHCKSNCDGFKTEGVTFPSGERQSQLIQEVYQECNIDPNTVAYVEAHGTGTKVGDPMEMSGISKVFCSNRKTPLLVGSVKSNMGHSENTSGLCGIGKVLLAMEKGYIAPNIHYKNPNPNIPSLHDGSVKVVDEVLAWNGGLAAVSCFGFGGVNVHVLLRSEPKVKLTPEEVQKMNEALKYPKPIYYCGRTEEAVNKVLDELESKPDEAEFHQLVSESALQSHTSQPYRGYTLLNSKEKHREVQKLAPEARPIWWVFTGMGSQWPGMGRELMRIPVFAESIERSHKTLEQFGLDLKGLLTSDDEKTFEFILNSFVTIAACQIALVDTLRYLGVEPDGIIGHSVGELGCSYADGCFTAEQMILAAYYRGKCVIDSKLPRGNMAAVGLSWEEAKARVPEGVVAACHNSEDSVTISGHYEPVKKFVEQLKSEGVFAKEVKCSNIGFHSFFMADIAPALLECLKKVITDPKPRSSRWLSTSIPEERWDSPLAKTSSPDYNVNNLVSPVLFHEALQKVPKNALVIEIAPHGLLQAILKRTLGSGAINIPLTKRDAKDNCEFFLAALGKLYNAGAKVHLNRLYPKVQYPVGRGTSSISPLVRWDHSQSWYVPTAEWFTSRNQGGATTVEVDISSEDSKDFHIVGHTIDGRVLFPATGYLCLVWRTLAKSRNVEPDTLPVTFENVQLHRATILQKTATTKFTISIFDQSGEFEVCESGSVVVSGRVYVPEDPTLKLAPVVKEAVLAKHKESTDPTSKLTKSDFYKELRLRGYQYHTTFQGVLESDQHGRVGRLNWPVDFIEFLDYQLQFSILSKPTRSLYLPTRLQRVTVNPIYHLQEAAKLNEGEGFPVYFDSTLNCVTSGGVEIVGMKASIAPRRQGAQTATLEEYNFVPHFESSHPDAKRNIRLQQYRDFLVAYIQHQVKNSKTEFAAKLAEFTKNEKTSKKYTEEEKKAYLSDHEFRCGLLELFEKLFAQTDDQNVRNTLQTNRAHLFQDELLQASYDERSLRPLVDTVIECTLAQKLKVIQVNASKDPVLEEIVKIVDRAILLQTDAYATDANTADLDPEYYEGYGAQCAQFDVTKGPTTNGALTKAHLVAATHCFANGETTNQIQQTVTYLAESVRDNGFVLVTEHTEPTFTTQLSHYLAHGLTARTAAYTNHKQYEEAFKNAGLEVVARKENGFGTTTYLLHKVDKNEFDNVEVVEVKEDNFDYVEPLKALLADDGHQGRVYLYAYGSKNNGVVGFVNCLRREANGHRVRYIFDPSSTAYNPATFKQQYKEVIEKDLVANVYDKETKQFGAYRHCHLSSNADDNVEKTEHAFVNVLTRGDLSSLRWIESPIKHYNPNVTKGQTLCHVYYAPLNFRDIMLASGKLPPDALPGDLAGQDCILGLEFAGRDTTGKRVMGLVPAKGLATTVLMDNTDFLWQIPDQWTMEQASTTPVAYATAYYALCVRGGLKKGESVLIHSGSGGVGQAAIAIALSYGCTVYTTVGSKDKRDYLKKRFPQLTDANFANSRDTTFEQHIQKHTNGKGVNLVLNSLAEEKLQASVRCLSQHGRFLEIGKYDLSNNSPLGMAVFLKNVAFHGILLDALFGDAETNEDRRKTVELVNEGIKSGVVKPLDATVFSKQELEAAFRYMATGKHVGKVVIKVRDEESTKVTKPTTLTIEACPRVECNPAHSYIITGGLGGFGLELAHFLIERGARHIVLTGRSGVTTAYQALCIRRWQERGVNVVVSKQECVSEAGAEKLITDTTKIAPVGGVFNLAMVLRDAMFENQTVDDWKKCCDPKVPAIHNLDKATRKHSKDTLRFFVAFSSISCGYGNAGQTNYGYANSVMERVCEQRKRDGFPGLAIQWGAIGDVGVVSERMGGDDTVVGGTLPQRMNNCLEVLDNFLTQTHKAVLTSLVAAPKQGGKKDGGKKANLVDAVANILGVKDAGSLNPDLTLAELGMDSLMGVEVKQTLERDYELTLSPTEIRTLTINKLKAINEGGSAEAATDKAETKKAPAQQNGGARDFSQNEHAKDHIITPTAGIKYNLTCLVPKQTLIKLNNAENGRPLYIMHPIEGNTTMLATLASKLNYPVYGLNCTTSTPTNSVQAMAENYVQHILKVQPQGPYNIAGYSFGAGLAFEVSVLLQKKFPGQADVVDKLVFLDGSPFYVSAHTSTYAGKYDKTKFQAEGEADRLCFFLSLFTLFDYNKVRSDMIALASYQDRLNFTVDLIEATGKVKSNRQDIYTEATLFSERMAAAHFYKASGQFKGDATLIRTVANRVTETLGEDYGLGKVVSGRISILTTDGDHDNFISGANLGKTSKLLQNSLY
jgi:fatty acid synthase